jgi:hypothetical protein
MTLKLRSESHPDYALVRVWTYLWFAYKDNGSVPKDVSDAISLIQERMTP